MTSPAKTYHVAGAVPNDTVASVVQPRATDSVTLTFRSAGGNDVCLILPPYMRAWADMTAGAFNAHMADGAAGRLGGWADEMRDGM